MIRIRRATVDDAAVVADLARRTFVDTFAADNRPEDMEAHVARTYGEHLQRREIENPDVLTLLAEEDGVPVAFAQLKRGEPLPCVPPGASIQIARFYVDKPWHGRGVAQELMRAVEDEARALGGTGLWLGVWERNFRAMKFYGKCGFTTVGTMDFHVGEDHQIDMVMARHF